MEESNHHSSNYQNMYKLTPEDMWKTLNINNDSGIEGYELVKVYFDHIKSKNYKTIWKKKTSSIVKCEWPPELPKDENGRIKWPKRKNYLDDVTKIKLVFLN